MSNAGSEKLTTDHNVESLDLSGQCMDTRLFTQTPGHPEQQRERNIKVSPVLPWSSHRPSAASILRFLPPRPVADYLIAVYFNTVHWFVVVVHEGNFLHNYREMIDLYARDERLIPNGDESFTFALLILTIVAMGGRYTTVHDARHRHCMQQFSQSVAPTEGPSLMPSDGQEFDISESVSRLFSVVHNNSTDNLACGNISTLQSMLLLGNLYLYHGHSNLALSQSACTIRIAYALGLHKEDSELCWASPYYQKMDFMERRQLKSRLFWAVHTSDRFLAMCYGLPPLIADEDCVADIPRDDCAYPEKGSSSFLMLDVDPARMSPNSTTLLTYQTHKLKFYVILGHIVQSLHRPTTGGLGSIGVLPPGFSTPSMSAHGPQSQSEHMYQDLPAILRIPDKPHCHDADTDVDVNDCDGDDGIVFPEHDDIFLESVHLQERRARIKNSIYGMQALLLQVAYDHALILIHRPILTLTFNELSFVGVHLFAAGVILSAFARSNPLGQWALEAKKGLGRVIRMQRRLKAKAIVSAQSLDILQKLAHEIMKKEEEAILSEEPCYDPLRNSECYKSHTEKLNECSVTQLHEDTAFENPQADDGNLASSSEFDTEEKGGDLLYDSFFDLSNSMAEVDKLLLNACSFQLSDFDSSYFTDQV
ncbi:uncharacterized protein N7511_003790 [Penicillium nucicola]|uniref:uncharacterized protein n=1 Tax=Penicillium nucicola TaxID=1850975 RepID=UPI002545A89B|nr:uncharacterized protein N7511_003790 [Penicillium nucicola]KAJ5766174.1 hypothetical protein N7511_003790 [Penicillium nucicola]